MRRLLLRTEFKRVLQTFTGVGLFSEKTFFFFFKEVQIKPAGFTDGPILFSGTS